MTDQILYNDEPILEVGLWKILCPNMYGKKYKNLKNPILVHKCAEYSQNPDGYRWSTVTVPERPAGQPQCGHCNDPIPDEIQGLMAMYYWDKTEVSKLPPAGNTCKFGNP